MTEVILESFITSCDEYMIAQEGAIGNAWESLKKRVQKIWTWFMGIINGFIDKMKGGSDKKRQKDNEEEKNRLNQTIKGLDSSSNAMATKNKDLEEENRVLRDKDTKTSNQSSQSKTIIIYITRCKNLIDSIYTTVRIHWGAVERASKKFTSNIDKCKDMDKRALFALGRIEEEYLHPYFADDTENNDLEYIDELRETVEEMNEKIKSLDNRDPYQGEQRDLLLKMRKDALTLSHSSITKLNSIKTEIDECLSGPVDTLPSGPKYICQRVANAAIQDFSIAVREISSLISVLQELPSNL